MCIRDRTLAVLVVVAAFSIQSRNGGLYLPSCSKGRNHHNETAVIRPSQPAHASTVRRSARRVRNHNAGRTSAAPVATAFTPPIRAKASAERLIRHSHERGAGMTRGSRTHGAMAMGHTSMEVIETSESIRGLTAYSSATANCAQGAPIPSARTRRQTPTKATHRISDHHSLWMIQAGTPTDDSNQWNGPIGSR